MVRYFLYFRSGYRCSRHAFFIGDWECVCVVYGMKVGCCQPPKPLNLAKTMASVFWDVQGVVLCEFLPKGETINANRYTETLEKLKCKIRFGRNHRRRLQVKKIILQHDNATPPHTARTTKACLERFGWDVLDYSPPPQPRPHTI